MSENSVLKIIRACLYAMVVLVPLFFWKWTMNPFIVVKTAIFQSLAGIIILLWIALAIQNKKYRPRMTPLAIGVLALMAVLTLSALLGEDLRMSFWSQEVRTIGIVALWFFALLFFALSSLKDELEWRKVWFLSLVTSMFSALGALLAFLPIVDDFFLKQGFSRPVSTFGNPSFLAGYLLFHVFLGVYLWHSSLKDRIPDKKFNPRNIDRLASFAPWLALVVACVDALAIFKTQTRGDMGGLVIGLFITILFLAVKKLDVRGHFSFKGSVLKNAWLWLVIFFIVLGGIFFFTRSSSFWNAVPGTDRFRDFTTVGTEFQNRLVAWQSAAESFSRHPVLGFGWENFNLAFQEHYNPILLSNTFSETYWDKPHNVLIEFLVTGGVVGFLSYLAVWTLLFYELFKLREEGIVIPVFFGMLVAYFVQNLVLFDTIGTYLMFFLVMAFIDARYRVEAGPPAGALPPHVTVSGKNVFAYPFLVVSLIPIFFLNWPIVYAAGREYWGPNYFLNKLPAASLRAMNEAVAAGTPYRDDIRLTFGSVVKQSHEDGVVKYADIANLQGRVAAELQKVIDHHPKNYLFYTVLADFKNTFHEFDAAYLEDAEKLEKRALELSPNRQQVYYVMGKTKAIKGDLEGAYNDFRAAVNFNPLAGDPHFYLGLVAYELHDMEMGRKEIERAEELGRVPRTMDEAIALGNIVGDEAQDYDAAIGYYKRAFTLATSELQFREVRLKMAVAYYLKGKYPEAKALFEILVGQVDFKSTAIWPRLEPVFNELGIKLPASPSSSSSGTPGVQIVPIK